MHFIYFIMFMFSMISPFYFLHSFIFCLSLLLTWIFFKVALQQIAGRNFPELIGSLDASKFKGYVLTVNCLLPSVHLLWLADHCHPFTFKGVKQLVIDKQIPQMHHEEAAVETACAFVLRWSCVIYHQRIFLGH